MMQVLVPTNQQDPDPRPPLTHRRVRLDPNGSLAPRMDPSMVGVQYIEVPVIRAHPYKDGPPRHTGVVDGHREFRLTTGKYLATRLDRQDPVWCAPPTTNDVIVDRRQLITHDLPLSPQFGRLSYARRWTPIVTLCRQ